MSDRTERRGSDAPAGARRPTLLALLAVYLVLLAWMVLWKLELPWIGSGELRAIKIVPFLPTADAGTSKPFELVVNVLLFIPFGVYLGLLAPRARWWVAVLVALGASAALEAAQWLLAVGASDTSDLVLNSAGALAGFGIVALARSRLRERAEPVLTRVCLVATVLAVLVCAAFIASPLRYAPPRAAAGSSPAAQAGLSSQAMTSITGSDSTVVSSTMSRVITVARS